MQLSPCIHPVFDRVCTLARAGGSNCFSLNSFGICPHMTEDNKELIQGKDLLVAYYDVDYEKNPKGSNYWRNR